MHSVLQLTYVVLFCSLFANLLIRWHSRKEAVWTITNQPLPRTCVIVTHFGWSDSIESNFRNIVEEAKTIDAQVIAVTQFINGMPDASYHHLKKIESSCSYLKVIISNNVCDLKMKCAQKCYNLIQALKHINKEDEIIIFIDNDASLAKGALRLMSTRLMHSKAISATGSRFYLAKKYSFSAIMVSGWVNIHHLFQKGFGCESHWGGFCALKNSPEIVEEFCNMMENSVSDDMFLNILVKRRKEHILLVDEAITLSYIDHFSFNKLIEFTNRQTVIGFRTRSLMGIVPAFLLLSALPVLSLITFLQAPLTGLIMWVMISVIFTIASFSFPTSLTSRVKLMNFIWLLFLPIIFILTGYNALYALSVAEVCWSGIRYKFNKDGSCMSAEKITH